MKIIRDGHGKGTLQDFMTSEFGEDVSEHSEVAVLEGFFEAYWEGKDAG